MSKPVLVAYSSRYGSTQEIAECLGDSLRQGGLLAEIRPCDTVHQLDDYQAVVLGSAIYEGQWLDDAAHFLTTHEAELKQMPLWLFSSGPTREGVAPALTGVWTFPPSLQELVKEINPRGVVLFAGKVDPARLSLDDWCENRGVRNQPVDYRNWDKIRDWAEEVAGTLNSMGATA